MLLLLSPLVSGNLLMPGSELNMSHFLPALIRSQVPFLSSDTINHIFIPNIPCPYENSTSRLKNVASSSRVVQRIFLAPLFVELIRYVLVEFRCWHVFALVSFTHNRERHTGIVCTPAGVEGG